MIPQIRPAQLDDWFQSLPDGVRPIVLDVREPEELEISRLSPGDGFDLLVIPMGSIPARLAEIDPDRPIACLCHRGARSQRVAMFLTQQGYGQVANIAGGIDAWAEERDPGLPRY